jgi:hypothetical protein
MKTHPPTRHRHQASGHGAKTHQEISRLAYQLYEQAGKIPGRDLEHWFNAEAMAESTFGSGQDHTEHDFSQTIGNE